MDLNLHAKSVCKTSFLSHSMYYINRVVYSVQLISTGISSILRQYGGTNIGSRDQLTLSNGLTTRRLCICFELRLVFEMRISLGTTNCTYNKWIACLAVKTQLHRVAESHGCKMSELNYNHYNTLLKDQ